MRNVSDYLVKGSNVYRFIADQLGSVRLVGNDPVGFRDPLAGGAVVGLSAVKRGER